MLDKLGLHAFEGLPILAFGIPPNALVKLTATYSYRLQRNFIAPDDYFLKLVTITRPIVLLVGGADELFFADDYASILQPMKPDLAVKVLPGVGHMGLIVEPAALDAVVKALGPA